MESKKGFTVVELLTTVTIIAMLISLLIPSLRMVRAAARDAKQRAQLTTIGMAISAFRNDYGDYPPSAWTKELDGIMPQYGGIQKLTEALVGWDLMGFHPDSRWRFDGRDGSSSNNLVYLDQSASVEDKEENLRQRRGPYLELATADAFKLEDLFTLSGMLKQGRQTYVLCDVYKIKKITITSREDNTTPIDTVKAGTPLLYYKANTSSKTLNSSQMKDSIYNAEDNKYLVNQGRLSDGEPHPIAGDGTANDNSHKNFYELEQNGGIADSKITNWDWPHRPDSYILISAGADGLYGTEDDMTNFK